MTIDNEQNSNLDVEYWPENASLSVRIYCKLFIESSTLTKVVVLCYYLNTIKL